jgi:hypothetical protein
VHQLADRHGIRQFLDIGTGLPTADNTHHVAQPPSVSREPTLAWEMPASVRTGWTSFFFRTGHGSPRLAATSGFREEGPMASL